MMSTMTMTSSSSTTGDPHKEELLSSLLSSPDFSLSSYLNLALSANDDDDSPEQQTADLALRLQIQTQACHDEIGRIGSELRAVLPRCYADVTRTETGLGDMEKELRGLLSSWDPRDGPGPVTTESSHHHPQQHGGADPRYDDSEPLATLQTLLNLKTHLTSARDILSAASNWDETIRSIPALLAASSDPSSTFLSNHATAGDAADPSSSSSSSSHPLLAAVAALSTLEAGERALRIMPSGRRERHDALVQLRARTEAMLRPQLLHALKNTETRTGLLRQCVEMYTSLGKGEVLREEYVRARPGEVVGLWFSFGGGAGGENKRKEESKSSNDKDGGEDRVDDFDFTEEEGEDVDEEVNDMAHSVESTMTHHDNSETVASSSSHHSSKQTFIEFLPSFYEAVLDLLSKERNQARLVFGAEMAPSVVARVLMECFKPIVSSFGKRLENVCPNPTDGRPVGISSASSSSSGGMEAIAAAYESTIQFLSLAYDQIEAWSVDNITSSSSLDNKKSLTRDKKESRKNDQKAGLVDIIRRAFLLVASPFTPYIKELAEAERHPLGEAASIVARDVRGVNNLEDASERLGDLAPFMFPVAEIVFQRYELLNSGYNPHPTLTSVDTLLSNHASELGIAAKTLSGNASSGREFDERHVHCALEILRIAGNYKKKLKNFESHIRERLVFLSQSAVDPLPFVDDSSVSSIEIPDALDPKQIGFMIAEEVCGSRNKYSSENGPPSILFPKALESSSRLAQGCRSLVFEVCYSVPESHLRGISALPVWRKDGGSGTEEEDSYGILPQSFVTHVGEHMLSLVQALEPFASDEEALGSAMEVMDGVGEEAIQPWKEFVAAAGSSTAGVDDIDMLTTLMSGKSLSKYIALEEEDEDAPTDEAEDPDVSPDTAFCNQWLDVVGMAVTGRLLERTMRIPCLGKRGAEHLAADLNYIINVFSALGVSGHPNPLLGYAAQLATLEEGALRERIGRWRGEKEGVGKAILDVIEKVERRMAYVRGMSV